MKSVYCAVRTWSLNKAVCASSLKGYHQTQIFYLFWHLFVRSLSIFMKLLLSMKVWILSLYEFCNSITEVLPLSVFTRIALLEISFFFNLAN